MKASSIALIGADLDIPGAQVIDARGKLVLPGGVDPHTHFDLPMFGTVSSDDHYTGHKAAAFGGTTTVIDFVPQDDPTLAESVEAWRAKADPKAAIDFGFHMNLTQLQPSQSPPKSPACPTWASPRSKSSPPTTTACACRMARSSRPCASPATTAC